MAFECKRARGPRAWVASCALLWACGDDGESTQPESFPVLEQRVPALGCVAQIAAQGACSSDHDCAVQLGERCVLDAALALQDRAPLSLVCAVPGAGARAFDRCERRQDCESGLCALSGVCLDACGRNDDCGRGQQCRPVEMRIGDDALAPVMACTRSLVLPPDVMLTVAPNERALLPGRHRLDVPGLEAPALIYAQGECRGALDVLGVRSNDLRSDVYERGKRGNSNPVLHDGSSLAALMFPINPALAPSRSGLALNIRLEAREHVDVVVASRAPGAHLLDLNVYYVGGSTRERTPGPGDTHVAKMLGSLDRRFRDIGLGLGSVREYRIGGALGEELAVLEVPRREVDGRFIDQRPLRLDELFSLSAGVSDPALNVFLIRDMGSFLGIAGGIPGVLGVHGTGRSGVALAVDLLGDLRDADLVLMHEIGHFLGLFHTTESSGNVIDPLADTLECGLDRDADHDRELASWECADEGADNLMFWSGAGASLSPDQIKVLASAVLLR